MSLFCNSDKYRLFFNHRRDAYTKFPMKKLLQSHYSALMLVLLMAFVWVTPTFAQKKSKTPPPAPTITKKPLTHDVYDGWRNIVSRTLSTDGEYAAYNLNPQEGDGTLVFQALKKAKVDSIQRGADFKLGYDAEYAAFKIKPAFKMVQELKRKKKKKEEMPRDSLGIYNLKTNALTKVANVLSYKMPEKAGGWLAYQMDIPPVIKPDVKKDTTAKKAEMPKDTASRAARTSTRPKKMPKKEGEDNGYKLVVKSLKTNTEQTFGYVTDYEFTKNGRYLAFSTTGNDSTMKPGVYVWDTEKAALQKLAEGKGKYKKLTFDENGQQLAFVADLDTNAKSQIRYHKLFYWKAGNTAALKVADETNQPGPKDWLVSGDANLLFAKDGSKLFFGTAPKPVVQDTTLLPEEIVSVEVWNWQDKRLQTQQKVTLEQDKKKSYMAVVNLPDMKMVQLGSIEISDIQTANEGRADYVLGETNLPYSNQHWDWNPKIDAYLISTKDGSKKVIRKFIEGNSQLSPEGKYVYWFSNPDTSWFAYSVSSGDIKRLTFDKKFADEDDDHPDFPNPYGIAGWTKGDEEVWIYDKFDIWAINPAVGKGSSRKLTDGRSIKKEFRYVRLDIEDRNIDVTKPLILRSFDHASRASGYHQLAISSGQVTKLYEGDFNVSPFITKAKNTDDVVFTRSTFREYPNLLATNLSFQNPRKISDANPQQAQYLWGTAEVVNYKSGDGTPLQGLLYKPDNFDPKKKYPLLVYFYEKNSENLHNFVAPAPNGSAYTNYSYATSNGYLVFVPDIIYKIGYPGRSAYECIIPGTLSIIDKGFVDSTKVGIVGHSWGGYQAAYLITQTNLFTCAVPGAPVVNMTSAYGGVRWSTGLVRQAQYEKTQTRIGGSLWEKPVQFLENSPLFFLDKVQTPTLILHNDADGSVPWYQGIEFFMGLKRLNKPVWMLNYNGEDHSNRQRKNQKDFTVRMWQYLDHFMKNAPAPSWMNEGLPMIEKGIKQHLETGNQPATKVTSGGN